METLDPHAPDQLKNNKNYYEIPFTTYAQI